jgi:hypothetical protein
MNWLITACRQLMPRDRTRRTAPEEPLDVQFEQLRGAWEILDADARASLAAKLDEVALAWMQYAASTSDNRAPIEKHDPGRWQ